MKDSYHTVVIISMSAASRSIRSRFDRLVNAIKPVVGEVAKGAFARNLISSDNLRDAENQFIGEALRASKLLSQIQDKIEERASHFENFVSVLRCIPVLEDLCDELERTTGESVVFR